MTRTARLTSGLLVLSAVLAACSPLTPDPRTTAARRARERRTGAEPSSPAAITDLEPVFGSQVAAREGRVVRLDRWSLVDDGPSDASGPAMRVAYPAGSVSPSASREHGAPEGGMQVFLPLVGEAADSACGTGCASPRISTS